MAEKEEKDDDLIMVGDGVEEEGQQAAAVDDKDDGDDDDGDDDDSLAAGDTRVGGGESDDDDQTEARKLENRTRRQRQKDARDRDKRELQFLRTRNERVEKQLNELAQRQTASETSAIDQRITQLERGISSAEDVYAKAIDAGEGKDAAEAQRIRDQLKEQVNGLKAYKTKAAQPVVEQDVVDPNLIENVRKWHGKNQWFDFGRRDEDSAIVGAIDDMMVRDGWDPTTPEYYSELDKRIGRRLPHLSKKQRADLNNDNDDAPDTGKSGNGKKPPSGPRFRVGGRDRPLKSNEVHISRERREAMEEAGVWEDPVVRKRYLAKYAEWDRNQSKA